MTSCQSELLLPFSSTSWLGREPDLVSIRWEDGGQTITNSFMFTTGRGEFELFGSVAAAGTFHMDEPVRVANRFDIGGVAVEEYRRHGFHHFRFLLGGRCCKIFCGSKKLALAALDGLREIPTPRRSFVDVRVLGEPVSANYDSESNSEGWMVKTHSSVRTYVTFYSRRKVNPEHSPEQYARRELSDGIFDVSIPVRQVGRLYFDDDLAAFCEFLSLGPDPSHLPWEVRRELFAKLDAEIPTILASAKMSSDLIFCTPSDRSESTMPDEYRATASGENVVAGVEEHEGEDEVDDSILPRDWGGSLVDSNEYPPDPEYDPDVGSFMQVTPLDLSMPDAGFCPQPGEPLPDWIEDGTEFACITTQNIPSDEEDIEGGWFETSTPADHAHAERIVEAAIDGTLPLGVFEYVDGEWVQVESEE